MPVPLKHAPSGLHAFSLTVVTVGLLLIGMVAMHTSESDTRPGSGASSALVAPSPSTNPPASDDTNEGGQVTEGFLNEASPSSAGCLFGTLLTGVIYAAPPLARHLSLLRISDPLRAEKACRFLGIELSLHSLSISRT